MPELIFIEGVSGVGKSTAVRALAEALRARGKTVRAYMEFDADNPIDFYCTACLSAEEHVSLCMEHPAQAAALHAHTIPAGTMRLVRYYDQDTPLFPEPLLAQLKEREFCWKPPHPVPLAGYTAIFAAVWSDFAASLDDSHDFIIFDGSLLHHPINDMMRNYAVSSDQALAHVRALLAALGPVKRRIFYLKTEDSAAQLMRARRDRGQTPPTAAQLAFWQTRGANDMAVLSALPEPIRIFDITFGGWDQAVLQMLNMLP